MCFDASRFPASRFRNAHAKMPHLAATRSARRHDSPYRRDEDIPRRQYRTLSKRIVDRLAVNGEAAVFWDREPPGFGVRVYPW